jgi:hypothetical protein
MRRLDTDCTCRIADPLKITGKRKVHGNWRRHLWGRLVPAQSVAAAFQSLGCGTILPVQILAGMAHLVVSGPSLASAQATRLRRLRSFARLAEPTGQPIPVIRGPYDNRPIGNTRWPCRSRPPGTLRREDEVIGVITLSRDRGDCRQRRGSRASPQSLARPPPRSAGERPPFPTEKDARVLYKLDAHVKL